MSTKNPTGPCLSQVCGRLIDERPTISLSAFSNASQYEASKRRENPRITLRCGLRAASAT